MPSAAEKHIKGIHKLVFLTGQYFCWRLVLYLYHQHIPKAFLDDFSYNLHQITFRLKIPVD